MNPNKTLTRYSSFTKLVSTIEQGLFIPKATLFQDDLEGVLPYFREENNKNNVISREEIRACMDWVYISCWHSEQHECHAMWQVYGISNEAVAIQTTESALLGAYLESKIGMHTYFDEVKYKNPDKDGFRTPESIRVFNNIETTSYDGRATHAALFSFMKHIGFGYEKETRLVAIDPNASCIEKNASEGFSLPAIITRNMIKRVLIHHSAPNWFELMVKELITTKYEMDVEVLRSSLAENNYVVE